MNEFWSFRKMMTPTIIKVIFWIAIAFSLLGGAILLVSIIAFAYKEGSPLAFLLVIPGLIFLAIGPFLARVFCELLILSFRIYDTLVEIRDRLTPPRPY